MLTAPWRHRPLLAAAAGLPVLALAGLVVLGAGGVAIAIAALAAGSAFLLAVAAIGTQRRLDEAQARLRLDERALPGRAAFLSWLNHELRSPLNACNMWLDVLALAPEPDKLTKAVDAIKRNLVRQTRLVNELSDATKVSVAGIELETTSLDLVELVERHSGVPRFATSSTDKATPPSSISTWQRPSTARTHRWTRPPLGVLPIAFSMM